VEFAQARKRCGRGLKKAVVEGWSNEDLVALGSVVDEVCSVRRWVRGPIEYFEDEIVGTLKASYALSKP